MKKSNLILGSLFAVLVSCITPVEVETPDEFDSILVVEGSITTVAQAHRIGLSRSAKYGDIFEGLIQPETGATVSVRDDLGNVVFLTETFDGIYETPSDYRGEVGVSYTLQVVTSTGTEFSSLPERIAAVPRIDSLYFEEQTIQISVDESIQGAQVFVNISDDEAVANNYFWSYSGFYSVQTNPELYIDPETGTVSPLDCCPFCYQRENSSIPIITQDEGLNGSQIKVPITFIEDNGVRFSEKYVFVINQASLTADAYDFMQLLEQQLTISGDIFDPPPATLRGNMINLTNPREAVIGFFRASDAISDTLVINSFDVVNRVPPPLVRGDCRTYTSNSTIDAPSFW
ncbi:MAG: DUF4249 domain-containing protein [Ekhidna sp.]|nr:DUF4249 domain-containing protein [Ekhidna sp.]